MNADPHELYRKMIDGMLAAGTPIQQEAGLSEHIQSCRPCQEYFDASTRVITALGDFSFDMEPSLQEDVLNALQLRSRQLKPAPFSHRRLVFASALAVLFTLIGSLVDVRVGDAIAALRVHGLALRDDLLTFWIVSSMIPLLLFPLLPLLGRRNERMALIFTIS